MPSMSEDAAASQRNDNLQLTGTPFEGRGRFQTFGSAGPMYEVLAIGDRNVFIFLFNSDEEVEYRLDHALTDPLAQ